MTETKGTKVRLVGRVVGLHPLLPQKVKEHRHPTGSHDRVLVVLVLCELGQSGRGRALRLVGAVLRLRGEGVGGRKMEHSAGGVCVARWRLEEAAPERRARECHLARR